MHPSTLESAAPEAHVLAGLQFKEKTLTEKIAKLNGLNEGAQIRSGHELPTAKLNAEKQLAEVRAEITALTPKPPVVAAAKPSKKAEK